MCVCVCVRERERERKSVCWCWEGVGFVCVCVCVCVCERERESVGPHLCRPSPPTYITPASLVRTFSSPPLLPPLSGAEETSESQARSKGPRRSSLIN